MMSDKPPLVFTSRLGGLFPANKAAEAAMHDIKGRVQVEIRGGTANQRRRGLYWACATLVVMLLNDAHGLTIDEQDLHDITRDKLRLYDEVRLPSGETHRRRRSTSNKAMNEHDRAAFTDRALALWSTWTGVDVTALRNEAENEIY